MTFEPATAASFEQSGTIHTGTGSDVIAILPVRSRELLRQLRQKARDAHSLLPEFADRQEANTARGDAERRLQRLLAPRSEGGFNLPEGDREVIETRRQLETLTDEARRLEERYQQRSEAWRSASNTLSAVENWSRNGVPPGVVLEDVEDKPPQLLKNENLLDGILRLQRRGRELKADLHRIRSTPYPSAHARAKIRQEVEALAQVGTPSVSDVIENDRKLVWPMQRVQGTIINAQVPSFAVTEVPDVLGLFAFVHKTALLASLDALVSEEADDDAALSHEERQQQEAEVMADLLSTECDEAALIWSAMAQGLPATHRVDCAPAAILQCRLITAPAVSASVGTSPEHVIRFAGPRW